MEDVHVRGLPPYLLQRGVGIAVKDSDESCVPVIRKFARTVLSLGALKVKFRGSELYLKKNEVDRKKMYSPVQYNSN